MPAILINASGTGLSKLALGQEGKTYGLIETAYCQIEKLHKNSVKRDFYQLKLNSEIPDLKKYIEDSGNFKWKRMIEDVNKNSRIWKKLFSGFFDLDDEDFKELSLNRILGKTPHVIKIDVGFIKNEELEKLYNLTKDWLKKYIVIQLQGEANNDLNTNNRNAEDIVKNAVEDAREKEKQGVIILASSRMGVRSFSVSEVEAVIEMYDKGSQEVASQLMLRVCTPGTCYNGETKKRGAIITLSIDPNRDETFLLTLLNEAKIVANEEKISIADALKDWVLDSMNIFRVNEVGSYIKMAPEKVIETLLEKENLLRIAEVASILKLEDPNLDKTILSILDKVKDEKTRRKKKEKVLKPCKTHGKPGNKAGKKSEADEDLLKERRKKLVFLNRQTGITVAELANCGAGYRKCIEIIQAATPIKKYFEKLTGILVEEIIQLIDAEFLNTHWLDLIVAKSFQDFELEKQSGTIPSCERTKNRISNKSNAVLGTRDAEKLWKKALKEISLKKKQIKILNVAAGYGTEANLLKKEMEKSGWNNTEIQNSLYLLDNDPGMVKRLKDLEYNNIIEKDFEKWKTLMKFDYIIGNPPYKRGLHLKFLKKARKLLNDGGKAIFVHPATWVLNEIPGSDIKKSREEIEPYTIGFYFFDGKKYFPKDDADLGMTLSITTIQSRQRDSKIKVEFEDLKKYSKYEVNSFDEINKYGNNPFYKSLKKKILKEVTNKGSLAENLNRGGKYYVYICNIIGTQENNQWGGNSRFFTFFAEELSKKAGIKAKVYLKKPDKASTRYIGFETLEEAKNCISYLKTFFARFCLSIAKFDRTINKITLTLIPWQNFKQPWSDEKLFNQSNLSKKEIIFIKNTIPKAYNDVELK